MMLIIGIIFTAVMGCVAIIGGYIGTIALIMWLAEIT